MDFLNCVSVALIDIAGVCADFKRFHPDSWERYFIFKMGVLIFFVAVSFFDVFLIRNGELKNPNVLFVFSN